MGRGIAQVSAMAGHSVALRDGERDILAEALNEIEATLAEGIDHGKVTEHERSRAMELGYNHPIGPLELTDVVGLDVHLDILQYLHAELGSQFRPPQIPKRKVRADKLGKKSGEGFYRWEHGEIANQEAGGA